MARSFYLGNKRFEIFMGQHRLLTMHGIENIVRSTDELMFMETGEKKIVQGYAITRMS